MTTLSRRATPLQRQMFRIVEGAIRDANHAHPAARVGDRMARSITKRAVGTLSAALVETLAGNAGPVAQPSDRSAESSSSSAGHSGRAFLSLAEGEGVIPAMALSPMGFCDAATRALR